jgi:hypothetical protein
MEKQIKAAHTKVTVVHVFHSGQWPRYMGRFVNAIIKRPSHRGDVRTWSTSQWDKQYGITKYCAWPIHLHVWNNYDSRVDTFFEHLLDICYRTEIRKRQMKINKHRMISESRNKKLNERQKTSSDLSANTRRFSVYYYGKCLLHDDFLTIQH